IVRRTVVMPNPLMEQPSLFSDLEWRAIRHSGLVQPQVADLSVPVLQGWKQRIVQYQQQVIREIEPTQGSLFEGAIAQTDPSTIDPFQLRQQNIEFWRWPAHEPGHAALYFVIDHAALLLLYVGETGQANQRWKGVHDCKRYVRNYITAHRCQTLPVSVGIGFWTHAPAETRARQRFELRLIEQWRSPFNKENWKHWGTPFLGGKD
ncbi:MAG: hypothetical protein WCD18_05450, partial [Thermosynechococcaceae cyanobacterium]